MAVKIFLKSKLYWDCKIQEEGEKSWYPIRLMVKLIGLRQIRVNVTVPFKLEFAKICGALAQIALKG
jgi:hypothetical protein